MCKNTIEFINEKLSNFGSFMTFAAARFTDEQHRKLNFIYFQKKSSCSPGFKVSSVRNRNRFKSMLKKINNLNR